MRQGKPTVVSDSTCCCAVGILALQPDSSVAVVKSKLEEEATNKAGNLCIFLPKYHCELNFIEMVWGRAKQLQRNECLSTTVAGQEANVRPPAVDQQCNTP